MPAGGLGLMVTLGVRVEAWEGVECRVSQVLRHVLALTGSVWGSEVVESSILNLGPSKNFNFSCFLRIEKTKNLKTN